MRPSKVQWCKHRKRGWARRGMALRIPRIDWCSREKTVAPWLGSRPRLQSFHHLKRYTVCHRGVASLYVAAAWPPAAEGKHHDQVRIQKPACAALGAHKLVAPNSSHRTKECSYTKSSCPALVSLIPPPLLSLISDLRRRFTSHKHSHALLPTDRRRALQRRSQCCEPCRRRRTRLQVPPKHRDG